MELTNFQIFKNKHKKEGTKQPDFRITAQIAGKYEEIGACWWKQDSKGNWYQSCSVKPPQKPQNAPQSQERPDMVSNHDMSVAEANEEDINPNDIPF